MRLTRAQREQLERICEPMPAAELVGSEVIIDGRPLRPGNPLAWRRGTVKTLERLSWLTGTPLIPRVDLTPRGSDPLRRREPVPAEWLLRRTPALMRTLQSLGLWRES